MKCTDFIAKFLADMDIKFVFDFTGGMIANLEDSISRQKGITCFPTRHEQAAGFAAEGYSRINNNFGVAIATSGPGATNLITAIGSCFFDSTSVLFITGQVDSSELRNNVNIRQNGFQETDIVTIAKSITKYANIIFDASKILYELEKCIFFMKNGRNGPVLLDIPFDVQIKDININKLKHFIGSKEHKLYCKNLNINIAENFDSKVLKLLNESKRPIIIAGNGVSLSKSEKKLEKFANDNNIPVVCSLMGLDSYHSGNKNFCGFIGTFGNRTANIITANADLVIALGSRLDLRQVCSFEKFSEKIKIIHVDIDVYSKKSNSKNYFFINTDLNHFFDKMHKIKTAKKYKWLKFVEKIKENFNDNLFYKQKDFAANVFFEKISALSPNKSIIIGDVGQNQMWLAQSWRSKNGQRILFSGGMGAMGFSIPTGIGAYCANKSANIMAFCGDGGFQINIQELETIKLNKLPIKIFVLNNNSLGMVREFQDRNFQGRHQSTVIGYSCPDIQKIAKAYGLKYFRLNNISENKKIKNIIKEKKPVIVEIKLSIDSKLQPKVMYGQSLENQYPYLDDKNKEKLHLLKNKYL